MNILMIDTSGPACGVALSRGGRLVCEMTLTSGLTYKFHCRGQELEASNVTAMKCANCGEMMFSWDEAQRIQKFAHESVGWEDI